jgi:hypothetical protein
MSTVAWWGPLAWMAVGAAITVGVLLIHYGGPSDPE